MPTIKELIIQREADLRARHDFNKISIPEMEKMPVPGDLIMRRAWGNILTGRIKLQKEIDDLTFSKDFFAKFDTLTDADKRKMFTPTDDGHWRLKDNSELAKDGIILSAGRL